MGTGYTRADTANNIADGNIINASDLDSEYDAIQSAFDASTGHTHDGTAGEGAPIETIGPSQDVVATASVLRPKTDNTVDLGTTSLEYKDLFLDGTAHIDTLDVDENASITGTLGVTGTTTLGTANITTGTITTADINGGNIDGTIIGATTAAAITGTTITGTSFVTSGDMTFGDNDKAIFGAGSDLQIYHDGTNSRIEDINGANLILRSSADVRIDKYTGENMGVFNADGSVDLYYDNALKLATTSTGISVTGNATFADNGKAIFGAGSDLQIYHTGTYSLIADTSGTGPLRVVTNQFQLNNAADTANLFKAVEGGAVTAYYDGSTKFATTSTGIDVTGTVTADGLTVDGVATLNRTNPILLFNETDTTDLNAGLNLNGSSFEVAKYADAGNKVNDVLSIDISTGDISFYEDTGTTAKFFWDASAESLGIGTTSPDKLVHIERNDTSTAASLKIKNSGTGDATIQVGTSSTNVVFGVDNSDSDKFKLGFGSALETAGDFVLDSSGNVGIGATSPTNLLDVNADSIRVRTSQTPASASATGNQGEIAWDADYIYICTATNTWKRVAISTW